MARNVLVNRDHVNIGNATYNTGDVVKVLQADYDALVSAGRVSDGTITDQGEVGDAVAPTALIAMTSAAAVGGTPTKAEYDALRTDVVNTRTYLTALKTALTGTGLPF